MNKVAENPFKNRIDNQQTPLLVVTALFVTLYLVSNVMAVKIVHFGNWLCFDAGTFTFPFAYMLGDVLTEIWGYKTAKRVILLTLLCNVVMVLFTWIGVYMPNPDYNDLTAHSYDVVFGYVPRIVLGSLVGFLCGEISNSWVMERIRQITNGRYLWLRTITSSVVGYIFDSVPFVLISFAGVVPWNDILKMVLLQFVLKLGIEASFGTPLAYLVIRKLRGRGVGIQYEGR